MKIIPLADRDAHLQQRFLRNQKHGDRRRVDNKENIANQQVGRGLRGRRRESAREHKGGAAERRREAEQTRHAVAARNVEALETECDRQTSGQHGRQQLHDGAIVAARQLDAVRVEELRAEHARESAEEEPRHVLPVDGERPVDDARAYAENSRHGRVAVKAENHGRQTRIVGALGQDCVDGREGLIENEQRDKQKEKDARMRGFQQRVGERDGLRGDGRRRRRGVDAVVIGRFDRRWRRRSAVLHSCNGSATMRACRRGQPAGVCSASSEPLCSAYVCKPASTTRHTLHTKHSMAASAVLRRQLARDSCVLAASPLVRLALVQATHATEAGRQQWGLTNAHASRLLGRAMVATALLAAPLEGEERVTMQFTAPHGAGTGADSPVASLRAEASAHGELRAFIAGSAVPAAADVVVANRPVIQAGRIISALALAPLPMSPALAHWNGRFPRDSVLTVSRILYNRTEAATSSVSIGGDEGGRSAGNVESDLAHLFEVSDQVASAVKLDVCTDAATDAADAGRLTYAGGVVGQVGSIA